MPVSVNLLIMKYTQITSASNPKIKEALDIKNKRSKYKHAAFIIEGTHLVETALASGNKINTAFFTDLFRAKKDGQKILREIGKKTDEIFEVTEQIMHKLADTETPQGIIATASYAGKNLEEIRFKLVPLIVAVDGVQEPGNLGTIIRTSDAAGADAVVILKGTCDVFMQKTIRATAGSIFNIPIIYTGTDKFLEWLTLNGIMLIATALDSGKSIFDAGLKNPIAFVFGNEAHGVSSEIKRKTDLILKIPIFGKAESLNVSASVAVCLYETVRQRL
ncbi:MAG TPA: RNA methyltransferase [Nitrospiraceae bacterium]|nr:RNA methyltransferase [Nitrospiraceae bacterium]HBU05563.1 RNA methyltransferase [Nitrospiraceae bacterium]